MDKRHLGGGSQVSWSILKEAILDQRSKEGREGAFELPGKEYSAETTASTKILRQGMPGVLEEGLGGPCGWSQRDRGKRWSREVMGVDPVGTCGPWGGLCSFCVQMLLSRGGTRSDLALHSVSLDFRRF